ncbi:MAG TPA: SpoIIE family protein phosphatase [Bryobacteraceae bacterium]|nr:SpoIIE family protein phosphatase [Bryobacteraceae bacterium]
MAVPPALKSAVARLGRVERAFLVSLALVIALTPIAPESGWTALARFLCFALAAWVAARLVRIASRRAIWRLRNRLIVTYLFIAVVPVTLIVTLAALSGWALTSQVAVFLVTSELDRRIKSLESATDSLARAAASERFGMLGAMGELFYNERFPGLQIIIRSRYGVLHYPLNSEFPPPPPGWNKISGVVRKDGQFWIWSRSVAEDGDVTAIAPLNSEYLARLAPGLGVVRFLYLQDVAGRRRGRLNINIDGRDLEIAPEPERTTEALPPPAGAYDIQVQWSALYPVAIWQSAGRQENALLVVRSRPSAVYSTIFSRKTDWVQGALVVILVAVSIAFLIVELISLVIGITMTRTITRAVHHLYEGTQRVMHGDFSHRIEVYGRDQLAELSKSFNTMTSRLEELIQVAKEKERLQSEIEIAREVQSQLYPKKAPSVRSLRITAVCKPARMVSGDYFDYECVRDDKVAIAIGDVAGKGISAALLMATLQSALRTELRSSLELAMAAGNGQRVQNISTARLVCHLNEQLHAYTSPEKYATFYLGLYDESSSELRYTNAGHLPPILIRNGQAVRLNVDGTVVGAFAFAQYDESRILMERGDLLVCFTDGVTEPENEYGEMFGEERLIELVTKNAHRSEDQIVESVIQAVEQWTGSPELQDDMTLLLARRQ